MSYDKYNNLHIILRTWNNLIPQKWNPNVDKGSKIKKSVHYNVEQTQWNAWILVIGCFI